MEAKCSRCGSERLLPMNFAGDESWVGMPDHTRPEWMDKKHIASGLTSQVCVDCGLVHLLAKDTQQLRDFYEKIHRRTP
jgi:hypothetical protein